MLCSDTIVLWAVSIVVHLLLLLTPVSDCTVSITLIVGQRAKFKMWSAFGLRASFLFNPMATIHIMSSIFELFFNLLFDLIAMALCQQMILVFKRWFCNFTAVKWHLIHEMLKLPKSHFNRRTRVYLSLHSTPNGRKKIQLQFFLCWSGQKVCH